MNNPANKIAQSPKAKKLRPVDIYFNNYATHHQNSANRVIHWISVPLIIFSLLGLVWAIPFPYIKFLGKYNGFFNWASFLIAFSIYYYYKLSPVLSYLMLLFMFGFSYGIIELNNWQKTGGPAVWQVCMIIFVLSVIAQFTGDSMENKKTSFLDDLRSLTIGPIWLLHFILKKFSIRY